MADGVALWFNQDSYDAATLRQLFAGMLAPTDQLLPRPGKRPGPGLEVTVGGTPESAVVQPGPCVIVDGTTTSYMVTVPTVASKPLAARPASGQSRVDAVIARVYDADVHGSTSLREVDIEVVTGAPSSGIPTPPTLPAGALRLALLTVPASGAVAVTSLVQRTTAAGGVVPVASQAERDALTAYDGLLVYREDLGGWEGRSGGVWGLVRNASDVSWTNITPTAAFGGTMRYKVRNGWVSVVIDGSATTVSGTTLTIASANAIPAAACPEIQDREGAYFAGYAGILTIGVDGSISALQQSGANRGSISATCAYPLK